MYLPSLRPCHLEVEEGEEGGLGERRRAVGGGGRAAARNSQTHSQILQDDILMHASQQACMRACLSPTYLSLFVEPTELPA